MSEDWKTAYEAWCGEEPSFPWRREGASPFAFEAGYLAQAETVERLRGALAELVGATDTMAWAVNSSLADNALAHGRQALADLQPKETR